MTLIELGEVSQSSAAEPPARPMHPRELRRLLIIVVALLTVVSVTGSVRPEPRSMRTLWRVPASPEPFTVHGETLYVQKTGMTPGVDARAMADGRLLWTYWSKSPVGYVNADIPGLALIPLSEQLSDGSEPVQSVIAVDATNGRERWRHKGELYGYAAGQALLVEWGTRAGAILRMHVVRTTDGSDVWSYQPPANDEVSTLTLAGGSATSPTDVIVIGRTGRTQVRKLADGALVTSAQLPWLSPEADNDAYAYAPALGDVLLMVAVEKGAMRMSAHDRTSLRPLWHDTVTGTQLGGLFECGGLLCRGSEQIGVDALDPRTGQVRWHSTGWDYGHPLGGNRMYVESQSGNGNGIVDMRTGQWVNHFPNGAAVLDPAGDRLLLLAFTHEAKPRMTVNDLRPDNTLRLAGALPPFSEQGCQLSGSRLVCLFRRDRPTPAQPKPYPAKQPQDPALGGMLPNEPFDQEIVVTDVG
jgi:outer membrane protein assembly factor BamB